MYQTSVCIHVRRSADRVNLTPPSFPPSLPPPILTIREVRKIRVREQRGVTQELMAYIRFGSVERAGMVPFSVFLGVWEEGRRWRR